MVSARSTQQWICSAAVVAAGVAALAGTCRASDFWTTIDLRWTDRTGNTHALGYADTTWIYSTTVGTYTDHRFGGGAGRVTAFGSATFDSGTTFSGYYSTVFGFNGTEWFRIIDGDDNPYVLSWGSVAAADGAPGAATATADNDVYAGAAFGISQFLLFGRQYALGLDVPVAPFTVRYASGFTGSQYTRQDGDFLARIRIDPRQWGASDVILHEMGHHVAACAGIATQAPGGPHAWEGDNITGLDRPGDEIVAPGTGLGVVNGSRMALSEGFATYFALSAVRSGNLAGWITDLSNNANNNGVTGRDTDEWYGRYSSATGRAYDGTAAEERRFSIETPLVRDRAGNQERLERRGEGCEMSVALALWDLYDAQNEAFDATAYNISGLGPYLDSRDRVTYGDRAMWTRILTRNSPQTFRDVWRNITDDTATPAGRGTITGLQTANHYEALAAVGETLEGAGIAFVPMGVRSISGTFPTQMSDSVADPRPEFMLWERNGGNSSWFRVLIFGQDWTLVNTGDAIAVGQDQIVRLYQVTADLAPGSYWWVVINSPAGATMPELNTAGLTGWYWSGARAVEIVPTPSALALLLLGAAGRRRRR